MTLNFDSIVIGAGVIGLSIARSLADTGREVLILEANASIGQGISSRNSEVIHAGIYYPYESLKRRLCIEGRTLLTEYCESRKIEFKKIGKLIITNEQEDVQKLKRILSNGTRNGVSNLKMLFEDELSELEPNLNAKQAIFSPSTGIIDSHGLMLALQGDFERAKGLLSLNSSVAGIKAIKEGFSVKVDSIGESSEVTCRELINSAGLNAQKISKTLNNKYDNTIPEPRYCKGTYYSLSTKSPFSRLIYPVPNNAGLGIHLTLDLAGRAKFGPDTEWIDEPNYEINSDQKGKFVDAIKNYFPSLNEEELYPDYVGVRPKIASYNDPPADFSIQFSDQHSILGYVALYGIESPGLTSALAIGEFVKQRLDFKP